MYFSTETTLVSKYKIQWPPRVWVLTNDSTNQGLIQIGAS